MTSPVFSKILIANRGEIVVRIIDTCRTMGIEAVAVYSAADATALHVRRADEARYIGPAPATESYLNIGSVLDAAKESGAEAVHPGYGFLAENASFAAATVSAGLVWIGPPASVIARMGDKVAAKALARSAGVPIVPGYEGEEHSLDRMRAEAEAIGYPIMLKAAAGGGGRGIRSVFDPDELPGALESASREALSAFGDGRLFLEKLIVRPRHIEIQILVDTHGNGVYLGERDCSIQRRHQKVIEEAPSPILTEDLRIAMGEAALRLARIGGYENAGTVEFLFSDDRFYFLEMNTRIQVEHPVTEMVTGLDLIRLQIEIASGLPLSVSQLDVAVRGHAIEARLYAEDAAHHFLPVSGRLSVFEPPTGPDVRNDVGIQEGEEVTPHYDPMLAKLIVHAENRPRAVRSMRRALETYAVLGLTTNLGFLHWISAHPDFTRGRLDTGWLEENWSFSPPERPPREVLYAAAVLEALSGIENAKRDDDPFSPWRSTSGWRQTGSQRTYVYCHGDDEVAVHVTRETGSRWLVRVDGAEDRVRSLRSTPREIALVLENRVLRFAAALSGGEVWIGHEGVVYVLAHPDRSVTRRSRETGSALGATAPMPGTVVKVTVVEGQRVEAHEPLMVLEAMKMEHVVEAPHAGTVRAILFLEGDMVPTGATVVELEEE